ncbi:MAG: hypothetical protein IJ306_05980 [Oscillospiraceae bacterium]|nr:hypothetical protein [Oscillospiraceae bacterium]
MSSNREKLKNRGGPAFENDHKRVKPFESFNPMQQERILTHMNTIGSKEEMRRLDASRRDPESGMMDTL